MDNRLKPITDDKLKMRLFGWFEYTVAKNRSDIKIKGDWVQKHIVQVYIPQLKGIPGAPKSCKVDIHIKAGLELKALFEDWEKAGLLKYILSWDGTFCPRLIRGSTTKLSNHAFGTAFDINAAWNPLGALPSGGKGTVHPLVKLANEHGFFWGGDYKNRKDGMHFEYSVLA